MADNIAPTELRVSRDRSTLTLAFGEGQSQALSAEMLRVLSPSAEVQGHAPDQRVTLGGKRDVTIADLKPVGHYAVRVVFSDGHDSGLYTWSYLRELADNRETRWQAHLDELAAKGLTR